MVKTTSFLINYQFFSWYSKTPQSADFIVSYEFSDEFSLYFNQLELSLSMIIHILFPKDFNFTSRGSTIYCLKHSFMSITLIELDAIFLHLRYWRSLLISHNYQPHCKRLLSLYSRLGRIQKSFRKSLYIAAPFELDLAIVSMMTFSKTIWVLIALNKS